MRYNKIKTRKNVNNKNKYEKKNRKTRIMRKKGSLVGNGPKINRQYIQAKEAEEREEEVKLLARWKEEEKEDQRILDFYKEKEKQKWLEKHFRNPKASNLTKKEKAVELLHQNILEKNKREELDRSKYDNAMRSSRYSLLENESGRHYRVGPQPDRNSTFIDTHGISINLNEDDNEEKEKEDSNDDNGYGFYAHDFRGGKVNKRKNNKRKTNKKN